MDFEKWHDQVKKNNDEQAERESAGVNDSGDELV